MGIPRIGDSPQSQSFYAHFAQLAEGSTQENVSRQFQVAPKVTSSASGSPGPPTVELGGGAPQRRRVRCPGISFGRFCPSECRGMTFNAAEQAGLQR
jgi:hypothetical protein